MITNKPAETVLSSTLGKQRLNNKTLFTTLVPNANNVNVRYFSSIDAEIYFEDVFIDETVSIEFSLQQQALPIFGYNSYIYDDIALGSRLIQGQFAINFTKASYMYEVLDTLAAIKSYSNTKTNEIDEHAPLWNKTFDIYMSYGDARQSNRIANSTILVLKQVSLTGCSQQLDYTGKPIYEVYTFVARDIDFLSEGESKSNEQENDNKNNYPVISVSLGDMDYSSNFNLIPFEFSFNKGYLINTFFYKLNNMSTFIEATECENVNTSQIDLVKTVTGERSLVNTYKEILNGLVSKEDYFMEIEIDYTDEAGQTHMAQQKLSL